MRVCGYECVLMDMPVMCEMCMCVMRVDTYICLSVGVSMHACVCMLSAVCYVL